MKRILKRQKGFASLIALIMVGMLTLIGLAAMSTSDDEVTITGNEMQESRAFYAAEAALEAAAARLHFLSDSTGTITTTMPEGSGTLNNCSYKFETVDLGPVEIKTLSNGTLAGLHAQVKSYAMNATAVNPNENASVELSQTFERALVPIFQFAVFYGNDLEIAPGADMSLIGRVHSNGDLWLQAANSLNIDSYVTASGNIHHGRKGPGSVDNGDVRIKDGAGNYVSMKEGSGWLESDDANWYDSSVARWDGRVQDSTHGQEELHVPLNGTDDAHKLIERADGTNNPDSYENKATLKIVDGVAEQLISGVWVDVTSDMETKGIITRLDNKFTDQREGKGVDVTELDIAKLYSEGYGPDNGVIYFAETVNNGNTNKDFPALRINNGEELDAPLTIASENPVYTFGDFNSINKQPASIMGDAVTFLSSNFDDALSSGSKTYRIAVDTKVNASIMTGNVETTPSNYNGGFENLPRFLEDWGSKDFVWTGSMVNLWYSIQANSNWNGTYYSPPNRLWSYDTDLDDPTKLPPESPVVRIFQRTGWSESEVGYANLKDDHTN